MIMRDKLQGFITVIITVSLLIPCYYVIIKDKLTDAPRTESVTEDLTFSDLLDAIEWVESKGDPWAVGDNGDAVGAYQIHEIYVRDVNRIGLLGHNFDFQDREDPVKSRKMVTIYLKHYGGTFEEMARKHNGGPQGHKKESTKAYWLKVKARMERESQ
jgi:hypothetical protein